MALVIVRPLQEGDQVRIKGSTLTGSIIALRKAKALVQVRQSRVEVPIHQLTAFGPVV